MKTFWLASVTILTGSFMNFLHFNGHSAYSLVAIFALALFAISTLPFAWLFSRHPLALVLGTLGLGWVAAELNDFPWLVIPTFLVAWLVFKHGEKPLGFVAAMFAVVGLTAPLGERTPFLSDGVRASGQNNLKPLVHIIMDGQGPYDYDDLGFTTWKNAKTISRDTRVSIPHILENHIEELEEGGYSVEIWQSDYLEIDRDGFTYPTTSLVPLNDDFDATLSAIFTFLVDPDFQLPIFWFPHSYNGKAAMELAVDRANSLRPGEAMIVHAIFPHAPYSFTETCEAKPTFEWGKEPDTSSLPGYYQQSACAKSIIGRLSDDVAVIIHGDHGHRLTDDLENDEDATLRAIFAVRGIPMAHNRKQSVKELVAEAREALLSSD